MTVEFEFDEMCLIQDRLNVLELEYKNRELDPLTRRLLTDVKAKVDKAVAAEEARIEAQACSSL